MQIGRLEIFTDKPEITESNIMEVLQNAMAKQATNAARCDFLLNYEAGVQKKTRKKTYRSDIDNWCVDNLANEITDFKLSYNWGNHISIIQRGEIDSGTAEETKAIALLNECYEAERIKKKEQELARFVEICGIGFTIVDMNTEWTDGDSYFTINVLDPRNAFIVRSSYYIDHRPMLGVSFRKDEMGNRYFTCFTKDARFEIENLSKIINGKKKEPESTWMHADRSGEPNPLRMIPIIEWIRSCDRMGCFERQIPELDNLNLLVSDFTNDVDQNTQAIWHGNDIEFPTSESGEEKHPKTNDWMITQTTPDGKTPFVKPLAIEYDYAGMMNNIIYRVNRIKEKCNVPQRNDNSGGSTGIAMSDATGWTNAEVEASKQDQIKESCKEDEVRVVLAAIKECPYTPADSPLLKLRYSDTKPSIKRQKNYEMTVKTTALANMLSHGIHGLHALTAINLFEDVNQVWTDSKEIIEKYQSSLFEKSSSTQSADETQTNDGGYTAQVSNSRRIDGMSRESPEEAEEDAGS